MTALNKQTLINLLIDSPLREAIKINLIDIVNNTNDQDLDKTYSTITKELEIYQKATERRLKLAAETIAQLQQPGGVSSPTQQEPTLEAPIEQPTAAMPTTDLPVAPSMPTAPVEVPKAFPPLPPLPPLPTSEAPTMPQTPQPTITEEPKLSVPPLDLPPLPTTPAPQTEIAPTATQPTESTLSDDESALQEIQKELDALKNSAAADIAPPQTPTV